MDILNQDIKYLPGVGPNRKKMLSNEHLSDGPA